MTDKSLLVPHVKIDRHDLAALTEALRDIEDSVSAGDSRRASIHVADARAILDEWRAQISGRAT